MRHMAARIVCFVGMILFAASEASATAFTEGVAGGDVTNTAAIVWTRVPSGGAVRLEVAADDSFAGILHTVETSADAANDFVIKIDVTDLRPSTRYYYRFVEEATGETSEVGTFQTAPAPDSAISFRFVYTGDSEASDQPFRILGFAADEQPDLWFWAGDTIYADGVAGGLPPATTLDDYHAKHRQNRADSFLRDLLRRSPVWTQWDDHEVANDYDGGDIEPEIGQPRVDAGQQAFFDYMPIRPQGVADDSRRTYRSFRYGALAEFFILDCRRYRSADLSREGGGLDPYGYFLPFRQQDIISKLQDPSRTMLGQGQLAWLKDALKASSARWKFILSSVPVTSLMLYPYDRWDGYEAERYNLLRFIDTEGISGVVILSADIHANVCNPDVTRVERDHLGDQYSPCFAVPEFIAGPIATNTFRQEARGIAAAAFRQEPVSFGDSAFFNGLFGIVSARVAFENKLRFVNADSYSYLLVEVTPDGATFTHKGIPSDSS